MKADTGPNCRNKAVLGFSRGKNNESRRPRFSSLVAGLALVLAAAISPAPLMAGALPAAIDLNAAGEDILISGASSYRWYNETSVQGDINGDGIDDLIVVSDFPEGPGGSRPGCGGVYIYYGKKDLSGPLDITGTSGTVPDVSIRGAAAADAMGAGVTLVADLNGDGIGDLCLGAWQADGPSDTRPEAGEAYIIYGSASLPAYIDIANNDQDVTIYGGREGDHLTEYGILYTADLNDDGIADLIAGGRQADGPADSRENCGELYVIYGSASLPAVIDTASGDEDVVIYGKAAGDLMGMVCSLGDVNADGIMDLLAAAWYADGDGNPSYDDRGEIYAVFGSASLPASIDFGSGEEDLRIIGATSHDNISVNGALDTGDVNGDGVDDIVMGSYRGDGPGNGRADAGEAYVVYGSAGLSGTINLAASGADVLIYGAEAGDNLAHWGDLFTGDVNGDGLDDIILGASNADGPGNGRAIAGEAYVIYGSAGLPAAIDLALSAQDVIIYGAMAGDELTGWGGLSLSDLNGDGLTDLLLGAYNADGPADARPECGEAYVIYGSASMAASFDLNSGDEDVVVYGADASDQLTLRWDIGCYGDINRDGINDLALAAYLAEGPNVGDSYVIAGRTPYITATCRKRHNAGKCRGKRYGSLRFRLRYDSGDNVSTTTAHLHRSKSDLVMPDLDQVADVYWEISTDRTNFTAELRFEYLDEEIEGLPEECLALYRCATKDGLFEKLNAEIDPATNTVTISGLSAFGFFILKAQCDAPPCFMETILAERLRGFIPF